MVVTAWTFASKATGYDSIVRVEHGIHAARGHHRERWHSGPQPTSIKTPNSISSWTPIRTHLPSTGVVSEAWPARPILVCTWHTFEPRNRGYLTFWVNPEVYWVRHDFCCDAHAMHRLDERAVWYRIGRIGQRDGVIWYESPRRLQWSVSLICARFWQQLAPVAPRAESAPRSWPEAIRVCKVALVPYKAVQAAQPLAASLQRARQTRVVGLARQTMAETPARPVPVAGSAVLRVARTILARRPTHAVQRQRTAPPWCASSAALSQATFAVAAARHANVAPDSSAKSHRRLPPGYVDHVATDTEKSPAVMRPIREAYVDTVFVSPAIAIRTMHSPPEVVPPAVPQAPRAERWVQPAATMPGPEDRSAASDAASAMKRHKACDGSLTHPSGENSIAFVVQSWHMLTHRAWCILSKKYLACLVYGPSPKLGRR